MTIIVCDLERRLKFDSGLTIGTHLIEMTLSGHKRRALAEIGKRGAVYLLAQPKPGDMYTSWQQVKGDKLKPIKGTRVYVWAEKDPEFMARFAGDAKPVRLDP